MRHITRECRVLQLCAGLSAEPGQCVVDAGSKADRFFVVASGTWILTAPEVNRGRSVLGTYHAGGVIAERTLYRAVAKGNQGKLPFAVECAVAGDIYSLPVDAFIAITQHVSAGAVLGMDNTEFLASVSACADVPTEEIAAVAARMRVKTTKAGGTFMTRVSCPPNGVYVIRSGSLTLTLPRPLQRATSVTGKARHFASS